MNAYIYLFLQFLISRAYGSKTVELMMNRTRYIIHVSVGTSIKRVPKVTKFWVGYLCQYTSLYQVGRYILVGCLEKFMVQGRAFGNLISSEYPHVFMHCKKLDAVNCSLGSANIEWIPASPQLLC